MTSLLDIKDTRRLRVLACWVLMSGLVLLGVLTTFAFGSSASQGSALPLEYDELVWAIQLPALYRVAVTLDLATWLGLGGFFVLIAASFARHAPIRSTFIAACGAGQLAGAIGACTRLIGVSDLAVRYVIATPDQQPALLRSFLDLQLVISAHFAVASLLWSAGLLLAASAAWSSGYFPPWLAGLLTVTGACNLTGDLVGIVGAPLPFALFILPLILLTASLFGVAVVCWRHGAAFPTAVEPLSPLHQEHVS